MKSNMVRPRIDKRYVHKVQEENVFISDIAPQEVENSALLLPANRKITLADSVQLFPLTLPAKGELLMLSARAPENVGLAVEVEEQGGWKTIGTASGREAYLEAPLRYPFAPPSNNRYRLRLWSMDRRETAVELSALFVSTRQFTETDLKNGITLSVAEGGKTSVVAAAVRIERGGMLRIPEEFRRLRWSAGALRPCEQAENFLPVQPGFIWIAGEPASRRGSATVVRAEREVLGSGEDKAIQIRIQGRNAVLCDLAAEARGPVVLIASSRVGRPAALLIDQGSKQEMSIDRFVVGEHSSLSLSLHPKNPVARLWPASPADEPFEVRLMQIGFPAPEIVPSQEGLNGAIVGKKARMYELSKGKKRMRISLGEALVAALIKDDTVASVHWAEGNPFPETLETDAERLLLLHTRDGEDHFAIEHVSLSTALVTPSLAIGAPFERVMQNPGRLRLSVAGGKGPGDGRRTLHVRGGKNAFFTDQTGAAAAGSDIVLGEQGGVLIIEHGAAPLLAWLDRPGEEAADLWATSEKPDRMPITLPALLPLEGRLRAYRINDSKPVMLHVRSASALATYLDRGEKAPEVEVHPQGVTLDVYLSKGTAELRLRPLGGASLSGQVAVSSSAVIPTDEGLGPGVLLAPGAARLFSFTVKQEGMIGAGVRADTDLVDMELLNVAGAVMGRGVAQMLRLKPGVYLLKLHAPHSAAPVKARPSLVGLRIPDTGPPPEEVRKYLYPETEIPAAYSSRRSSMPQERISEGPGDGESASDGDGPESAPEPEYDEGTDEGTEQMAGPEGGEGEAEE